MRNYVQWPSPMLGLLIHKGGECDPMITIVVFSFKLQVNGVCGLSRVHLPQVVPGLEKGVRAISMGSVRCSCAYSFCQLASRFFS